MVSLLMPRIIPLVSNDAERDLFNYLYCSVRIPFVMFILLLIQCLQQRNVLICCSFSVLHSSLLTIEKQTAVLKYLSILCAIVDVLFGRNGSSTELRLVIFHVWLNCVRAGRI